jgi:hypothetical protein
MKVESVPEWKESKGEKQDSRSAYSTCTVLVLRPYSGVLESRLFPLVDTSAPVRYLSTLLTLFHHFFYHFSTFSSVFEGE